MRHGPHPDPDVLAYEARRAQEAAEPHRLDTWWIQQYRNEIFTAGDRAQLDAVTKRIWRRYGSGPSAAVNQTALEDLKRSIVLRREQLELEPYRLTDEQVQVHWQDIFATGTREELDRLTRRIWSRYGRGAAAVMNQKALAELKQGILIRRTHVSRANPR